MLDVVVEGNAYLDGNLNKCCIGIEDGKIVAIKKILKGDRHLDFGDKLILPAGIDLHVHFRDPGFPRKENFKTGTMAAAFGGISCIFDMPNTNPLVVSKKTVLEKLDRVSKKAFIDFGLYSSLTLKTNIQDTASACSAFKIYLGTTTGKLVFSSNKYLAPAIYQINQSGKIPAIHAESENILKKYSKQKKPIKNLHDYLCSRPNEVEADAISHLIKIAEQHSLKNNTNSKNRTFKSNSSPFHIHICHLSTAEGVELLQRYSGSSINKPETEVSSRKNNQNNITKPINPKQLTVPANRKKLTKPSQPRQLLKSTKTQAKPTGSQKRNAVSISAEVTPHHLLLNQNSELKAFGKVNPPLRCANDQAALWSALTNGTIQVLASDHAPHTIDEKTQEFHSAPAGIPGVETMLPLMLSYVKHHKLSLDRFVSASSTMPAKIHNLPKGRLAVGYDGDLIVINFYEENGIKIKNLHSKCGWTPYEKMDAVFPMLTMVRGNIIVKDGNIESEPGFGNYYN